MKKINKLLLVIFCWTMFVNCYAADSQVDNVSIAPIKKVDDEKQWSLLYYWGSVSGQPFADVVSFHYSGTEETMFSMELAYALSKYNFIGKILDPYAKLQLAVNVAQRFDTGDPIPVTEGDVYLVLRWQAFPWNNYVTNTVAVGDGISYVTHVPLSEINDPAMAGHTTFRKTLNYLMMEVTFAIPKYKDLQLVYRLHHRCNAWGMYGNAKQGSTAVGVGLRYSF